MGYVAVKGGQEAIENAARLVQFERLRHGTAPIEVGQILTQMRALVDRVMGEGSLYAPEHAALALKQMEGDSFEAAFLLRAWRATLTRKYTSAPIDTRAMLVRRRISSAFRDIPGGQILGPTRDYTQRLFQPELGEETPSSAAAFVSEFEAGEPEALIDPPRLPKVVDQLVADGLMRTGGHEAEDRTVVDVTREAVRFPAPRSASLQMLARAETGGLMAMGYSTMRGFAAGGHGTVGELRVGEVGVVVMDPRGRRRYIGRITVTECEMVNNVKPAGGEAVPYLGVGYGLCFGHNETKAIAMGMLDNSLREPNEASPANSQEFTLYHTEGVESYGFTNHLKLPHYVTFQSGLDNLRETMARAQQIRRRMAIGLQDAAPQPVTGGMEGV